MDQSNGVRGLLGPKKNLRESQFGLDEVWRDVSQLPRLNSLRRAIQLFGIAWRSFLVSPFTSLMTLLSISVILTLFALSVLIVQNLSAIVSNASQREVVLRLFIRDSFVESELSQVKSQVSASPGVISVSLISKSAALEEFRRSIGEESGILEGLGAENPLPASLEVKFSLSDELEEQINSVAKKFESHPAIEKVVYSQNLVGQIAGVLQILKRAGSVTLIVLLVVSGFIITVTIRLAVHSHRQEIAIMHLVGASPTFVRAPFIIEGVIQGAIGALISIVIVQFAVAPLFRNEALLNLQAILGVTLSPLASYWLCSILLMGPSLGVVGSYLAVRKIDES